MRPDGRLLALAFLLLACEPGFAACTGDPRYDDLWCARRNLDNGTYDRGTQKLRNDAEIRKAEEKLQKQLLERANARAAAAKKESEQLQARVNAQQEENQRLKGRLDELRKQVDVEKKLGNGPEADRLALEIVELEERINRIRDVTRN